jgi:hypothetical protein
MLTASVELDVEHLVADFLKGFLSVTRTGRVSAWADSSGVSYMLLLLCQLSFIVFITVATLSITRGGHCNVGFHLLTPPAAFKRHTNSVSCCSVSERKADQHHLAIANDLYTSAQKEFFICISSLIVPSNTMSNVKVCGFSSLPS